MTDPAPAQQIRNLCDQVSDIVEDSEAAAGIANYGGTEGGNGSRTTKYPMSDDMLEARQSLKQILTSWALLIRDEGGHEYTGRDETTAIAAWIYGYAEWMARHPLFEFFIPELTAEIQKLRDIINRCITDRQFVGWDNGRPIFAVGEEGAARTGIGATLNKGRAMLAISALDADLPARDCAEALQLHGHKVTPRQILKLSEVDERRRETGKIGPYEGLSPVRVEFNGKRPQPIFRVGEVLNRIEASARHTRHHAS